MRITDIYGYKCCIDQHNKVNYILVYKCNGVERLRPYKWDNKINDWVNVSGNYTYGYIQRLYRNGKIIYK